MEDAVVVSLVAIVLCFPFRAALIPILTLPVAVVACFLPVYYLHVSSNIMSLGGIALAIGVLVDASIVMVENGYKHLAERQGEQPAGTAIAEPERRRILLDSARQIGP